MNNKVSTAEQGMVGRSKRKQTTRILISALVFGLVATIIVVLPSLFALPLPVLLVVAIFLSVAAGWFVGTKLVDDQLSPEEAPRLPDQATLAPDPVPSPELPPPPAAVAPDAEGVSLAADQFRQLIEDSPNGHLIAVHNEIVYFNASAAAMLNLPAAVDGHLPAVEIVPEDQREALRRQLATVVYSRQKAKRAEYRLPQESGAEKVVELVCSATIFEFQPAIHLVFKDMTEAKQIEAELTERNRELTILQSAGVAITSRLDLRYVLDTVAHEMAHLFEVGQCTIFEWQREENQITQNAAFGPEGWWDSRGVAEIGNLADLPLTKIVLEDQIPLQMNISQANIDPREHADMLRLGVKSRFLVPMVFQRQTLGLIRLEDLADERVFSYKEISLAKLLAGQAASAIENARLFEQAQIEIAVRKQAESELEQERALLAERVKERTMELSKANAELARAARLKDEFLASMSHELRTPLNTILGSAEILQAEVFGQLAERQTRYITNIDESGRHLLSLINDILDLSKIEAGKMDVSIAPVGVKDMCQASLRLVKQLAHKKQIRLKSDFQNHVSTFPADERRFKQILVNLLSNAIKFTPEGGEVGLAVSDDLEQEVINFCVWDTGIGIAPADMQRLFEPFVQLDSSLSRQHAGTGLGLSLVSKMMELHGGGVSVESEPGAGSRFTVSFPLAASLEAAARPEPVPEPVATAAAPDRPATEPPLVLLAEDNEYSIGLFTDYLALNDYRFSVARNGLEAIAQAKENKPDIILMDIQMPELDGLEAMRRLRAEPAFANTPIVAMTALAMPGDRERCLEAGANEYLSKPVNLQMMVNTIRHFVRMP